MRAHVIEKGVVINTIEVDSLKFIPGLIDGSVGAIGWLWDGKTLTAPVEFVVEQTIPDSVTRRQGRLALLRGGYLDDVEAAIAAITDPVERQAAQIEYEADTWERGNAFLQQMWTQLGGTKTGLDELFSLATSL